MSAMPLDELDPMTEALLNAFMSLTKDSADGSARAHCVIFAFGADHGVAGPARTLLTSFGDSEVSLRDALDMLIDTYQTGYQPPKRITS
jgi:hypothetical protein